MTETRPDTSIDAFERYLHGVRMPGTAGKYASAAKIFVGLLADWGYASLEDVPSHILSRYASHMGAEGFAPATTHMRIAAAKRYLRWVREQGIDVPVPYPPDMPRVKTRLREILPAEFVPRYMQLASEMLSDPYLTAIQLMPCVGLRGNELANLPLSAVSKRQVVLRDGSVRETWVLQLEGKGGDERIVPILDEGKEVLLTYFSDWRRKRRGPWLFPKPPTCRKPISDRTLREALSKLCEPLGMDFSPHTMRRTYLVTLWRRGMDATVIARIAGHKSIQTTYKHYLALDDHDILRNLHGERRGV
jgi:integrase/recombinase XerD